MTQALEKRHAAKFPNDQLDINGGFTFEGLLVAGQAWLAAKSTKADALMDALRKTKIDQHVIIGGPIQFDAKGQNVNIKAAAVENLKRKPPWCCRWNPPPHSWCSRCRAGTTSGGLDLHDDPSHSRRARRRRAPKARGGLWSAIGARAVTPLPARATDMTPGRPMTSDFLLYLAQAVTKGLLTGMVYGLMALGLSVIFGVMRVVNFAHGEMMVVGMYLAWMGFEYLGLAAAEPAADRRDLLRVATPCSAA